MTVAAAESFIRRAISDHALVQRINASSDKAAINEIFLQLQLNFDPEEFEQGYFKLLTHCRIIEQAEAVREVKLWWDCLGYTLENPKEEFNRENT